MPLASVIIPCFNCEEYVQQSVESALRQTVNDIEIICVDNNSKDRTSAILGHLAANDSRIKLVFESESGEGPARDAGFKYSTGKWVYFLDSDDLMQPYLLEEALERGEQAQADIVIFKTEYYENCTGIIRECPECFQTDWINTWIEPGVFNPSANPELIFNSFQNWVHNKLFNHKFLTDNCIHFQHLHRMADVSFTCMALAKSKRIALLDKVMHLYRVGNSNSALNTGDSYPLDIYEAFLFLKTQLIKNNLYSTYRSSFVNWAEEAVAMNLYRSNSLEGFKSLFDVMKKEGLDLLDISDFPETEVVNKIRHECCMSVKEDSLSQTLFKYFYLERRHLRDLEIQNQELNRQIHHLKALRSYRLHEVLVKIRNLF